MPLSFVYFIQLHAGKSSNVLHATLLFIISNTTADSVVNAFIISSIMKALSFVSDKDKFNKMNP